MPNPPIPKIVSEQSMQNTKPTITVFQDSPDRGAGLARDMRVRWALEEVGQPYDVRFVSFAGLTQPEHLARHPFGQIPIYEEDDLVLFESGAIVLHLAERHPGLLPVEADRRARVIAWIFAALNTVEPPIIERDIVKYFEDGKAWQGERFAMVDERIRQRLNQLVTKLGDSEWLDGAFSAADILMVHVLRRLEGSGLMEEYPTLRTYVERAQARPAYKRAFDAQLALVTDRQIPAIKAPKPVSAPATVFTQSFFHGTKADLKPGDSVVVGHQSNFLEAGSLSWSYFSSTMDAAIWGAELARGDGRERIYVVEPTGAFEDDPNLTDKKFPGNPSMSYRSREPLRVVAEVTKWQGHPPDQVQQMKEGISRLNQAGEATIID